MDISIMYQSKVYALSIREETEMCRWVEREKTREEICSFSPVIDIKEQEIQRHCGMSQLLITPQPLTNFLATSEEGNFLVFSNFVPDLKSHFCSTHLPLESFLHVCDKES